MACIEVPCPQCNKTVEYYLHSHVLTVDPDKKDHISDCKSIIFAFKVGQDD